VTRLRSLLVLSFIESFATILIERAVYFYSSDVLGFSEVLNLWMALILGVGYVAGAFLSHAVAMRITERRVLFLTVSIQWVVHVLLFVFSGGWILAVGMGVLGFVNGMKWPVVESYISAGRPPREAARAVGSFNMAWASAVPLSLVLAGPIIDVWASGLFLLAVLINSVTLVLLRGLPRAPTHLTDDHPERLPPDQLLRYRELLRSSRWNMVSAYTLTFLMAPLLPGIFDRLQVPVIYATGLSSLFDGVRVLVFYILRRIHTWHGRLVPAFVSIATLPLGFFMVIFGQTLVVVLTGEVIFGVAASLCYYASLYYAMVVGNASVGEGGVHEGLIGLGFSLGPAFGLTAGVLAVPMGGPIAGMLVAVGPVMMLCGSMATRSLCSRSSR